MLTVFKKTLFIKFVNKSASNSNFFLLKLKSSHDVAKIFNPSIALSNSSLNFFNSFLVKTGKKSSFNLKIFDSKVFFMNPKKHSNAIALISYNNYFVNTGIEKIISRFNPLLNFVALTGLTHILIFTSFIDKKILVNLLRK